VSLSGVLHSARFALDSTAAQTSVVSRNIAGANDASYVRKFAEPSGAAGGTRVMRAESPAVFAQANTARSQAAGASALQDGLDRMRALLGGLDAPDSTASRINALRGSLREAAIDASDPVLLGRAVDAADRLAGSIRAQALGVADVRADADAALGTAAERMNGVLSAFESLNSKIVLGTRGGQDVTDLMDQRDVLMKELGGFVGLKVTPRADNDVMLTTDSGVMLFETRARPVSFQPATALVPGQPGGRFLIDGIAVAGPGAVLPVSSGAVAGLVQLRDGTAMTFEAQLDETARMLVSAFRESDQTGGGKPDTAGLFVIDGAATIPPDGMRVAGLAQRLAVADIVNPAKGGDVFRLRDGAINGDADYRVNSSGAANFAARLQSLSAATDTPLPADPAVGLGGQRSVTEFANRSFGWLEEARKAATGEAEFRGIVARRADESLASATGVSLDAEMTRLLELERSYAASAKLISVVDSMLGALMGAIR
jgi:flagellar hook-associated protein 1 FlgK